MRTDLRYRQRLSGFTLLEMMIVIAIIAVLAGLLLAVVPAVMGSSQGKVARAQIAAIMQALSEYEGHFGEYPPSTLPISGGNGINEGSECLVICLSHRKLSSSPMADAERLINLDRDQAPGPLSLLADSTIASAELFEISDPFGNPFVYFNGNALTDTTIARYQIGGQITDCKPAPPDKTGRYPGYGQYQLISAGENGQYEQGGGDDITHWASN